MKKLTDAYEKIVYWSEEDEVFIGVCPEFFGGGVHGDDPEAVFKELLEVVDEWAEIFRQDGKPLPEAKHAILRAA